MRMQRNIRASLAFLLFVSGAVCAENLYNPQTYRPLVGDVRAYRAGDNLTILVVENSSAASSADTNGRRNTDVGFNLFDSINTSKAGARFNNDFDGRGTTQRAGKLLAQLTVKVESVAPNGDLWVKGDQLLEINDEKQQIRLEGRVRPQDIAENNTVISNRLSDAKISYQGDGVLAERQKPGILARVLMWLGF